MEIIIADIPAEGLRREGTLPPSIFDLPAGDAIRPVGDVTYEADIYSLEGLIAFSGRLRGSFELQCGTCLEYFDFEADFPAWTSDLELEEGQTVFDLAEIIREDFLLDLPANPRCDELVEGRTCPKAHLVVRNQVPLEEEPDVDEPNSDVWSALDELK